MRGSRARALRKVAAREFVPSERRRAYQAMKRYWHLRKKPWWKGKT